MPQEIIVCCCNDYPCGVAFTPEQVEEVNEKTRDQYNPRRDPDVEQRLNFHQHKYKMPQVPR